MRHLSLQDHDESVQLLADVKDGLVGEWNAFVPWDFTLIALSFGNGRRYKSNDSQGNAKVLSQSLDCFCL